MKVTIKSYSNGYLIDTPEDRYKVGTVQYEGLPVDIKFLVIEVKELEIDDNTANMVL